MGKRTRRVRVSGVPVCIALINRGSGAASSSGEHSFKSQVGEHDACERKGGESVGPNSDYRPSPLHGSKSRASSRKEHSSVLWPLKEHSRRDGHPKRYLRYPFGVCVNESISQSVPSCFGVFGLRAHIICCVFGLRAHITCLGFWVRCSWSDSLRCWRRRRRHSPSARTLACDRRVPERA
jgi:hypothetical protein